MTIRNRDKLRLRLKAITSPASTARLERALFVAAQLVENEYALSITRGAVSGAGHVASKPGEAPNADSHRLDRSAETVRVAKLKVKVQVTAPYATRLEFGDSKIAPRPAMRPARDKKRKEVIATMARAVDHILQGK